MDIEILRSERFNSICPQFVGGAVFVTIHNTPTPEELWSEITQYIESYVSLHTIDEVKASSPIQATRAAYKAAGKDPSRYRPSNEQLSRRILQGKGLHSVNTVVDLCNLLSLESGYSTGAIDIMKIDGCHIILDFGQAGEPYEGIGRGPLNIENLPAYRDASGAFATPTSDSTRTMSDIDTTRLLLLINGYDGDEKRVISAMQRAVGLFKNYASASDEQTFLF